MWLAQSFPVVSFWFVSVGMTRGSIGAAAEGLSEIDGEGVDWGWIGLPFWGGLGGDWGGIGGDWDGVLHPAP